MLSEFINRLRALSALPQNIEAAIEIVRERAEKLNEIARNRPNYVQTIDNMGAVIGRKNKCIAELESELANARGVSERHALIAEELRAELGIERETIASLRSGALPWRPIGEYEPEHWAVFMRDDGGGDSGAWAGYLPLTATHFLYLDQSTPKPAPKVVAWAVAGPEGNLCGSLEFPLVWSSEDKASKERAFRQCQGEFGKQRGWRAVRLVILENTQ